MVVEMASINAAAPENTASLAKVRVTLARRAAIAPMPSGAMHTHAQLGRHRFQVLLAAIETDDSII
jgi:hypothetical protein